jgi:hypothetical protein
MKLGILNLIEYYVPVLALKWQVAREENVHENSEGPYIALRIVFSIDDLRCHVVWRPCDCRELGVRRLDRLAEPKIDELYLAVSPIHDILRFYISMYYATGMAVANGSQQLFHDFCCFSLLEHLILLSCNFVEQLTSRAVFHDKVHILHIIIGLVILYDIRVIELRKYSHLLLDSG